MSLVCHKCGTPWPKRNLPGRRDRCQRCGSDMRCCRNCRHYAAHAPEQCLERDADPVTDKERSNFCEFWLPRRDRDGNGGPGSGSGGPPANDPTQNLKDILGI